MATTADIQSWKSDIYDGLTQPLYHDTGGQLNSLGISLIAARVGYLQSAGVANSEIAAVLGDAASLFGVAPASISAPSSAPITATVSPTGQIIVSHDPATPAVTFPPWLIWGGLGLAAYLLLK